MASSPWIRHFHAADGFQVWILETERIAYAFGLDLQGVLQHLYWGPKLRQDTEYGLPSPHPAWHLGTVRRELTVWGGIDDSEPCLKLTFPQGVRSSALVFNGFEIGGTQLTVTLRDPHYSLIVNLLYRSFPKFDILERSLKLVNTGQQDITTERAYSATWHVPLRDRYRLIHLAGRWFGEFQIQEREVALGKTVLESRTRITSYAANPFFALLADDASETSGEVWFGALAYSGNWQLPRAAADKPRPVLYNSWEFTLFDVDTEGQIAAANHAAELGVELFVVDDGRFKGRKEDNAGLGDWEVDRDKFPDGLGPLIDHVRSLGMDFGIWAEPEMVNPDSDLYRAHPDWVYHFLHRERSEVRQQLVLNFAREDVQDFIYSALDTLLKENDIRFLKMDMNRPFSEAGWPEAEAGREREIWFRHTQGLYSVLGRLRDKHPHLLIEACAGGAGRVDFGILRYTDQFWQSDNSDAFDVLRFQEGSSLAYTPKARMAWVTDRRTRDLFFTYRFHVAMTGALGIGADLSKWLQAEREEAKGYIALHKKIRDTVQHGKLYRLRSPRQHDLAVLQFVSERGDEAVVFVLLHSAHYNIARCILRLQGLEPESLYTIHDDMADDAAPVSGAALPRRNLTLSLQGDFQSRLLRLRRLTEHGGDV